jgi:hypothetical protein
MGGQQKWKIAIRDLVLINGAGWKLIRSSFGSLEGHSSWMHFSVSIEVDHESCLDLRAECVSKS